MSPSQVMLELCADSRLAPPPETGGMYLHLNGAGKAEDDPHYGEANTRPPMPEIIPLSHGPGGLDKSLVMGYLDRTPAEALDRRAYVPLLSVQGRLDLPGLAALADDLRLPVQIRAAHLVPGGQPLGLAQDRVVPLDQHGRATSLDRAWMLRVVPAASRSAGVYGDVTAEIAEIWADRPYLSGRLVFGPNGVELGLPPGLVDHSYGPVLAGFGRPLDSADTDAVRRAGSETVVVAGYAELLRLLESPTSGRGIVEVDDEQGVTRIFIGDNGPQGAAVMDPGTGQGVVLAQNRQQIRFTPYVGTLVDLLHELRFGPQGQSSRPIVLPPHATVYGQPTGTVTPGITVLGDGVPASFLDTLVPLVAKVGQPIVVLGKFQADDKPRHELTTQLGSLFEQHLWAGKVPIVINRGMSETSELHGFWTATEPR
ncbi:hypothetical protein [Fodinicola feengrottensis]|uniref:hypothetical protein n=1 Tax=Fodinicola feengrottensis TaxID=435914 RepID=UPI0013D6B384|nr:hypothetical protein [Fodinicola feengrottensis]